MELYKQISKITDPVCVTQKIKYISNASSLEHY
jgi:hypothetical protein